MQMLRQIGDPAGARAFILDKLARKEKIPGFGHRVYRCEDPRVEILRGYAEILSNKAGDTTYFEITREVQKVVEEKTSVFPNVDLYTASLYNALGLPMELFTPIFAISRTVGWTSHILEQWSNNKLIRPRAEYIGPKSYRYIPIQERTRG
jgi:citrate synthase